MGRRTVVRRGSRYATRVDLVDLIVERKLAAAANALDLCDRSEITQWPQLPERTDR